MKENKFKSLITGQPVFEVVSHLPEFPGGMAACMQFLAKNIRYPTNAKENGTQGRVLVQAIINGDSSIVGPKVVRSVSPNLDREAIRVVQSMPKWNLGVQDNA